MTEQRSPSFGRVEGFSTITLIRTKKSQKGNFLKQSKEKRHLDTILYEDGGKTAEYQDRSYGYRPNTSAHEAVRKAEEYLESGYHWVVDADIKGFFDHVDHSLLMDLVTEKVSDGRVLSLIESFLISGIMNEGIFEASTEGTPQGGNLSPLLANIYLHHFNRRMSELGYVHLRYADDILIFCQYEWEA